MIKTQANESCQFSREKQSNQVQKVYDAFRKEK